MITKKDLVKYLNQSYPSLLSTKKIATHFNVSQRTIQNYIKDLKLEYPNIININRKGVSLSTTLMTNKEDNLPASYRERKSFILRNLLINNCSFQLDELAEVLCISEVTLQNEIKKIRRSIEPYDLTLKTKNNNLFITGTVKNKKALMIQLIYGEAENSLVSLDTLNDIFQNYDAERIRDIILDKLNIAHFFMDEYSLMNLLLHIIIAMDQQQSITNIHQDDMSQEFKDLNHHFVSIINEVCYSLENLYNVSFTSSNRYQFTLLLMTRAIRNKEIEEIDQSKLSVSTEILGLTHQIIEEIYKIYEIDLNTKDFFIAFSLHIKNMLIRLNNKISIHNPLLYSIKSTSPFIYDIAVYISNFISKQQHVHVYDDEIAYIALHIGARIEELNCIRNKLKVILVCPQYYSYYNAQFKKIETSFHDDIVMTSIVTNPIELDKNSCDLIITTIPLENMNHSVLISNFYNDNDKDHISKMIKSIKKEQAKTSTLSLLEKLIDKELFQVNAKFESKQDAIISMGNTLLQYGYVQKEFIDKVLDRENLSPTNFGMIAIPHPIDYYANKTVVEIAILHHPIPWGNTDVSIIFMFCINKRDFSSFSEVFSFLAGTCSDDDNLECLSKSSSYEDFMKNIKRLY